MKEFIIILLFIFSLIFFIKAYKRNVEIDDITNKIKEENEKLLKDKESIINEIKFLNEKKEEKNKDLEQLESVTNNLDAAARQAFSEYCDSLNKEYYTTEAEYDAAIADLKETYNNIQDKLMEDVGKIKKELDKITATRAAAMEAQLKEKEIKEKKAFYCPQIPEIDLKDAKTLKDIEYKLNNPRVLRMLIWSSFYQKPINQVCANVLGGATVEKTGIYKITNQKTELVYIGQAVDIATRWKNHAKCGLGIDTPAGNKLYKSMIEDGLENFSFEVLEECSRTELNEKEKFYIELYQSDKFGYNSNSGINKS